MDVCEASSGWDDAISATVRISNGCTGVLLNNTNQDHKPYILTAYHCGRPTVGETVNWTFYFNDQVQDCSNLQPPSSNQIMQRAVVRAARGGYHDYVLLELLEPIPSAYNVSFAGWSIADAGSTSLRTRPTSGTVIGHPQGDLKKLTKDDDPIDHYGTTHWVGQFDHGTVEVGSSGSPLFNEQQQVVGLVRAALQMKDACSGLGGDDNEAVILFPKVSYNWEAGAAGERLSEFLDPAGTGANSLGALPATTPLEPPPIAIWINEVNAVGKGQQKDEYIEIVGPAGTSLTHYQIDVYSCSRGKAMLQYTHLIDEYTLPQTYDELGIYLLGGWVRTVEHVDQHVKGGNNQLPDRNGIIVLKNRVGEEIFDYQYDDAGGASECPSGRTTRSTGDASGPESMGFPMNTIPSSSTLGAILSLGTPGAPNAGGEQFLVIESASFATQAAIDLEMSDRGLLTSPYPNPFNPETSFSLGVAKTQAVTIAVYDMLGRRVEVLFDGEMAANQSRAFVWEAGDRPSGLYFIRVIGERFAETRQVTLIK